MTEPTCEEVRRRLALGETATGADRSRHLAACASCRREAERLQGVLESLAESAAIEPGAELDRRVRGMLLAPRGAGRWELRPGLAAGLGAAALLALIWSAADAFARAGAAELGVGLAVFVVGIYFAVSIAASVPVFLLAKQRSSRVNGEVRS